MFTGLENTKNRTAFTIYDLNFDLQYKSDISGNMCLQIIYPFHDIYLFHQQSNKRSET